jgi:hypothetical protein
VRELLSNVQSGKNVIKGVSSLLTKNTDMPFFSNNFTTLDTSPAATELALQVPQMEGVEPAPQVPDAPMEGDGPPRESEGVRCDPSILAIADDIFVRDGERFKAVRY